MTKHLAEVFGDFTVEDIKAEHHPMLAASDHFRDLITPADAGHILWVCQDEEVRGVQPGEFMLHLIKAALLADPGNFVRIQLLFPGPAWASKNYTSVQDGPTFLRARFNEWGEPRWQE
jgi:hypothetical protein